MSDTTAQPTGQSGDQSGDEQAFQALARQVIEPVRRYLARRTDEATAADVLSEVLLVMWRRLEEVPAGEPLPWVYVVARNCLHNAQRSMLRQERLAARVAVVDPPVQSVPAHHDQDPGELASWQLEPGDVQRAVAALPAASAEVVRLWAWEQLTPAQIAQVVGSSANAVSIRLHRAKKQLAMTLAAGAPSTPGGPPNATGPARSEAPAWPSGQGKAAAGAGHEADEGPSPGQRHGPPDARQHPNRDHQRSHGDQEGRTR